MAAVKPEVNRSQLVDYINAVSTAIPVFSVSAIPVVIVGIL
jgi:hypothetical protein